MRLSVILIAHKLAREISRTLQSLSREYQLDSQDLQYEFLVNENGSDIPLDQSVIEKICPHVHYHCLQDSPSSPAFDINYGVEHSKGDILCLLIDVAHMLTRGVFELALAVFRAFLKPDALTRYFFLGPGEQNESVVRGYNQEKEDELLRKISWPDDGYRLSEIGTPLKGDHPKIA